MKSDMGRFDLLIIQQNKLPFVCVRAMISDKLLFTS
ncbi:hypothetical protein F934_00442 [Acinetobacter beijerinckii ANC 3835]|uniref:Uncharacterized protein n=1 Tax=Acinetobacter beijerinckii ANC 3835 TaxID=1217649 RepID=N9EDE1_9GAMM|nr:hypothetical protein F934_00442 [Acinetobacter beijerinckii ANC 3835]